MTHARQEITMTDPSGTSFIKQKSFAVSKLLAFLILLIFIGCLAGTGLLVYHFTACHILPEVEKSTIIVYDKYPSIEATTGIVIESEFDIEPDQISTTTEIIGEELKTENTTDDLRLPKSIVPHSYDINLISFIQEGNFTFHGEVTILINVTMSSDNITLHAEDLNIDKVSVYNNLTNEKFLSIKQVANDTKRQFLIIYLSEPVEAGKQYYISIKFRGNLNDLLQGFYRSSYKVNNETRWIATTQFQPTDARRAFPCFDEPLLKAKFKISLARPKNLNSISNMPKIRDSEPVEGLPDYEWDHFQESVPMSTYLVAFVISDFKCISDGTFSVCARQEALSQAKYALEIGPDILQFYENFFGIKYPLPKLDMIALPDFSAGAMENWGLITYRESALLYEEHVSSIFSQQGVAHVVAHELAHQWFGNLVTPDWWTDIWLNEGFATYMEYIGSDYANPQLKELDQFLIMELYPVFALDGLKSSHQISIKVNNPDQINDIFDKISYSKGAAVINMIQHFLTMDVFRKGVIRYLKSKLYQNADQDDLWKSLTEESYESGVLEKNSTIKEIMDTWTLQTGLPVVTAIRNYDTNAVTFRQERFLINNENKNETSYYWWIPVTYADQTFKLQSLWMRAKPEVIIQHLNVSKDDWLLVNVNQTGYYRVNYDIRNWNLITAQLQKPNGHLLFDVKNRAQLLNDAFSLASVGYLDYEIALNVSKYLKQEKEYIPWKTVFSNLDYIHEMFVRSSHFDKFKNYILNLLSGVYNQVGFNQKESDLILDVYNRFEVISRACKLGVRDCIINSYQQFQTWKNSPYPDKSNSISVNLRDIVYCTAISVGGQEEWDFAWQRYLHANVETEKETLLTALGCSKEIWILSRYLEWSVTENSGIRKQDSARVFIAVISNPIGQDLSYRFLKTNWNKLRTYLGTSSTALSSILKHCAYRFNTEIEVDDLKSFVKNKTNELGVAFRTAQQAIEQAQANVEWMTKNSAKIIKWLSSVNS